MGEFKSNNVEAAQKACNKKLKIPTLCEALDKIPRKRASKVSFVRPQTENIEAGSNLYRNPRQDYGQALSNEQASKLSHAGQLHDTDLRLWVALFDMR